MLKIGILGAARIAPLAVLEPAARRDDVVVRAVASRRSGKAADYAKAHGIERAYEGYEALLADPEIDLVYNALPPVDHARLSIEALEAGKHVLCEKPFAMNAREAQVMVDTAARTGKRLIEAFHYRYHPAFMHLLELKTSGALGRITSIEAVFDVSIPYRQGELRHMPDQGGGALMDLGCYQVHWVRSLMDSEPEVTKAEGALTAHGVDERMSAVLRFKGDVEARIACNMAEGVARRDVMVVEGEKGRVELDHPVHPYTGHSFRQWLEGVYRVYTVAGNTTYDHQLQAVIEAVSNGRPLPTEQNDPVGNMRVIDAIYETAGFGPR